MYKKNRHIHFMGIGGIGMSGIALVLREKGYIVSGCDLDTNQKSIKSLIAKGCLIHQGNNTDHCHDSSINVLVYSTAISQNNPEIVSAKQRGIPVIHRSSLLAELMRTHYSIAISGSHGKTTTSSLIAHILIEAKLDPTIIIGGHLKNIMCNAQLGAGPFLVAEADESDRSFLALKPTYTVITNIDLEHLETYSNLDDIKESFKEFINSAPFYGFAVVCIDNENIRSLLPTITTPFITYGTHSTADFSAHNILLAEEYSLFTVKYKDMTLGAIHLSIPGHHNILNGLAAIAVATQLEIPFHNIANALQTFTGVERRFSFRGIFKGAEVFDDYGHHPEEIYQTLQVAKKRAKKELTVVFQPHRYSRTQKLWDNFIETFLKSPINHLIITDIYGASEQPIPGITAKHFAQALLSKDPSFNLYYVPYEANFVSIKAQLETLLHPNDLLLLLGAGKLDRLPDTL